MFAASTSHGIFDSDTVGLLFTYGILLPALVTGLIAVAKIGAKGEKDQDAQIQGRWGRRHRDDPDA